MVVCLIIIKALLTKVKIFADLAVVTWTLDGIHCTAITPEEEKGEGVVFEY